MVDMTAWVPAGVRAQVAERTRAQKARRRELAAGQQWAVAGLTRREAAGVRARWRAHLAGLRGQELLLDSVDRLAACGIRAELAFRGWDRAWPEVPEEARDASRWPGSRDGGFPEALSLRLPDALAEQVRGACWHTSADAVRALRDWRDAHPDIVTRRRTAPPGQEGALAAYERLAARVTTTGTLLRAGILRGITAADALTARPLHGLATPTAENGAQHDRENFAK